MKKLCIIFTSLLLGIVMAFGAVGCNADSSEFQKKIDDLQSQIEELEDKLGERDATIEELNEQIKKQEEEIEQLEKELEEEIRNGKEPVGAFYTVKEASENGWLMQDDIMSIAYYHNGGRVYNEEIMSESYEPTPKTPSVLSITTELKIKITATEIFNEEHNRNYAEADGFTITEYCGTYGDCVAVMMEDKYSGTTGAVWTDTITGINIFYNSGREIKIWRGIKQADKEESVGVLYTLQEAYENGWLTQEDLLSIAYYHNGGRAYNEEIMSENYQPAPKMPEVLSEETELKIKITAAKEYREKENMKYAEADGFTITQYCGTYGDCVAVMLKDKYTGAFQAVRTETIAGVNFRYPNSRTLTIWRETK